MSWTLLIGIVLALGLSLFAVLARRSDLARMKQSIRERDLAVERGSAEAQLQHPVIDLSRCLGCGTCVSVCPEDGVLELVHGQAMVVNGGRCVGISACERECPVDAITVTIANLEERDDIPAITSGLEAVGSPGLFLAGEVTAHALIKTAVEHGTRVGGEVARRTAENGAQPDDALDLCVVGAGPAGLACSLEAIKHGLDFVTLDQASVVGGTVAKYPRRKMVMTEPVVLPLHGKLKSSTYTKEELIDLWQKIAADHQVPLEGGQVFVGLERRDDGVYVVQTEDRQFIARNVCLALGRRGVPNKLGVPGEELSKVAYSLLDAHSFENRKILVVGGGDSAVEAALALAEQPGNEVILSYRKDALFRIRTANQKRVDASIAAGRIRVAFNTEVRAIRENEVELVARRDKRDVLVKIPNDEVFVMVGGTPPFELLQHSGVSFDPEHRESSDPILEQGTGLSQALAVAFVLSLFTLVWVVFQADYYILDDGERATHDKHQFLRSGLGLGLWMGIGATALVCVNLLYLIRRSPKIRFRLGSLQMWMTSHVATGILALLFAFVHAAMAPGDTPGGHAFWALVVLLLSGAIGRYFYAYVPRAANGRELELAEVKARMRETGERWSHGQREIQERARESVFQIIEAKRWRGSFIGRVLAILGVQRDLHRVLNNLAAEAREQGIEEAQVAETVALARSAHRTALMAAHFEDLRSVLNTWRYVHRWVAALMVLLLVVHIVHALTYGAVLLEGGVG